MPNPVDIPNDNRAVVKSFWPDPDVAYVKNYVAEMVKHFADCQIDFTLVVRELTGAIFKTTPGRPYDSLPDEWDLRAGLMALHAAEFRLTDRVKAYRRGMHRVQADRLAKIAARHGCSLEDAHQIWAASQSDASVLKTGLRAEPATEADSSPPEATL